MVSKVGLERKQFSSREEWLARRMCGIGGSEAAAVCGMSPWMTPVQIWRIKCGGEEAKDLSGNAAVQQGMRMEPALREFFKGLHPEYIVEHHPFDILYQSERPFLFATLDGELTDKQGRHGVLEIKTATPNGKAGWEKWSDGQMPQNYYIQVLHQLLATGYDFAVLFAALYSLSGDITLRQYEIERAEAAQDLTWLLDKETEFWRYVEDGALPPMPLTI